MDVALLGPVEVRVAGQAVPIGSRQQRLVLAVLALEVNRLVPTGRLIDLLWPVAPPRSATNVLQVCISKLRRILTNAAAEAPPVMELVGRDAGYFMRADPMLVDAHRFRSLVKRANHAADVAARAGLLNDALSLWSGPALADVATDHVRDQLCLGLEEARLIAVEDVLEIRLRLGEHRDVLDTLTDLVAANPLREQLVAQLMLALHRCGCSGTALDLYRETKRVLADQAGLDPSRHLQELELSILRSDPTLDAPAASMANSDIPNANDAAGQRTTAGSMPLRRPLPAQLPATVNLIGRSRELADVSLALNLTSERLQTDSPRLRIALITGTAGIGKTALAVYWAHQTAARFPDGQLYIDLCGFTPAGVPLPPDDALRIFLDSLGVPPEAMPVSIESKASLFRSLLAGRRTLVVLDNAASADQVRPLLPGSPACAVLVTSRSQLAGLVAGQAARMVALSPLPAESSRELLFDRIAAHRPADDRDRQALDHLVNQCGGLPLALSVVAARAAAHPQFSLSDLAETLNLDDEGLDGFADVDPALDVRAVFSWSYQALSEPAARLFRLLALHPGTRLSVASATSIAGEPANRVTSCLEELTGAHLLTQPRPGRYAFHDLIRSYALELGRTTDSEVARQGAVIRVLDHYLHSAFAADRILNPFSRPVSHMVPAQPGVTAEIFTNQDRANGWFRAERDTLVAAVDLAQRSSLDRHVWQLARAMVNALDLSGGWSTLITVHVAAVGAARRLGDMSAEAGASRILGRAHAQLGSYSLAAPHHQRALALYEQLGDRTRQAHSLIDTSWMYALQEMYANAASYIDDALEIFGAEGNRFGEAVALNAAGFCRARLGEYQTSLEKCERALATFVDMGDPAAQADALDSLAYCHAHLGDHHQAIARYQLALVAYREVGDRYHEAATLDHLADAYRACGEEDLARAVRHEAVAILDALHHPDAARVRTAMVDQTTTRRDTMS